MILVPSLVPCLWLWGSWVSYMDAKQHFSRALVLGKTEHSGNSHRLRQQWLALSLFCL